MAMPLTCHVLNYKHIRTVRTLRNAQAAHDYIQATLPNYNAPSDAVKLVILLYGEDLAGLTGEESLFASRLAATAEWR